MRIHREVLLSMITLSLSSFSEQDPELRSACRFVDVNSDSACSEQRNRQKVKKRVNWQSVLP